MGVETEVCVICGKQTGIPKDRHIELRYGYVEGCGQLCAECYDPKPSESYRNGLPSVVVNGAVINSTPNDADLGRLVRESFWKKQSVIDELKKELDGKIIYESPDGGKTVYARPFGASTSERVLVDTK